MRKVNGFLKQLSNNRTSVVATSTMHKLYTQMHNTVMYKNLCSIVRWWLLTAYLFFFHIDSQCRKFCWEKSKIPQQINWNSMRIPVGTIVYGSQVVHILTLITFGKFLLRFHCKLYYISEKQPHRLSQSIRKLNAASEF